MPFDIAPPEPLHFALTEHYAPLFEMGKWRYKGFWGGRGSMKSVSIARALVTIAHTPKYGKLLILCTREFQNSIADSVHRELVTQIDSLGFSPWFDVYKSTIISKVTGTQFIFKGLHYSIGEIKSMTGVNICWVEEAQSMSKDSLLTLDPTLRAMNSEIWFSFNPDNEKDPIYEFLVKEPPPDAYVRFVNWRDNPWFPQVLEKQRTRMMNFDPDSYSWVWEGNLRKNSAATIFRNKAFIQPFDPPDEKERLFHGADWGFSQDPSVLIRCFIRPAFDDLTGEAIDGDDLYIDQEAYGYQTDIDALPALFDQIDTSRDWPIKGDSSRPETISYVRRQGFSITAAEKWNGSVEDGIAHLRGFRKIFIHPRCEQTALEARLYSYKIDRQTKEVLPIIVDKWNHCFDAIRYALDGYIHKRGGLGVWEKLAAATNTAQNRPRI